MKVRWLDQNCIECNERLNSWDAVMLLDGYKTELAASIALVNADKNEKTIYTLNGKGVTI